MITKEESTLINFMTPGTGVLLIGRGQIFHIVKMNSFFKNILLYFQAYVRQTQYIVVIPRKGLHTSKFHDPRGRGSLLGRGHIIVIKLTVSCKVTSQQRLSRGFG